MTFEHETLANNFYDEVADHKRETFAQIKKRVLGNSLWPSKTFNRISKEMFDLSR